MADLLPCPWCGKTDRLHDSPGPSAPWCYVCCGRCDVFGPLCRSADDARARWNARATVLHTADEVTP